MREAVEVCDSFQVVSLSTYRQMMEVTEWQSKQIAPTTKLFRLSYVRGPTIKSQWKETFIEYGWPNIQLWLRSKNVSFTLPFLDQIQFAFQFVHTLALLSIWLGQWNLRHFFYPWSWTCCSHLGDLSWSNMDCQANVSVRTTKLSFPL